MQEVKTVYNFVGEIPGIAEVLSASSIFKKAAAELMNNYSLAGIRVLFF